MENETEGPLIIIFLAKLTLRCHIPPLLNVPPILTTNSDVERLIYMGSLMYRHFSILFGDVGQK